MLDHLILKSTFVNAAIIDVIYASVLAFLLGVAIAFTYMKSFSGLSYSRTFLQTLIYAPLLTAIAMQAVGDSVARGLGMMGAFSLLRFRTNIKDTRDMMFIFASLGAGLACGVYAYPIALVGAGFFALVVFVVHKVPFSAEADFDAVLRLQIDNKPELQSNIHNVLRQFTRRFNLISIREMSQGERLDLAFQLKMQSFDSQAKFMSELARIESLRDAHMFMQGNAHEV